MAFIEAAREVVNATIESIKKIQGCIEEMARNARDDLLGIGEDAIAEVH